MADDTLRFSPDILSRLGEELVPHIDQGLIELARNAYDADASHCDFELINTSKPGGKLIITDDGLGMSPQTIRDGWLLLGKSAKASGGLTVKYKRKPVGNKGLGRLAALRAGKKVTLYTRPEGVPGKEFFVEIDWPLYDKAKAVEDVSLVIKERDTNKGPGSEIVVENLRNAINRSSADRLARNLLLLSDPFESSTGFKAKLKSEEYRDLENKVGAGYFDDAEYHLVASHAPGQPAEFIAYDWKDEEVWRGESNKHYDTIPFQFDLWVFILNSETFSTRKASLSEVRSWLDVVGGVHVIENGMRIPPYGGAGSDWLEMNLRRAKSPEERPSTNTSVGRVKIENDEGRLIQKTDRVGFIENDEFLELKQCCKDALDWLARKRLKRVEAKRQQAREDTKNKAEKSKDYARSISEQAPESSRPKIESAVNKLIAEREREVKSLRNDLQLYRSLATAGMSSAVFAHEIEKPISLLGSLLKRLSGRDDPTLKRPINALRVVKDRLLHYAALPLKILAKDRRRTGKVDVKEAIEQIVGDFDTLLKEAKIRTEVVGDGQFPIWGSFAILDGIFANLIANSIKAFQREDVPAVERAIRFSIQSENENILVLVEDNAGGILGVNIDEIWLPGITTTTNGTGFGLTIVRDSISDLGGKAEVVAVSDFGGATFKMNFPRLTGNN